MLSQKEFIYMYSQMFSRTFNNCSILTSTTTQNYWLSAIIIPLSRQRCGIIDNLRSWTYSIADNN